MRRGKTLRQWRPAGVLEQTIFRTCRGCGAVHSGFARFTGFWNAVATHALGALAGLRGLAVIVAVRRAPKRRDPSAEMRAVSRTAQFCGRIIDIAIGHSKPILTSGRFLLRQIVAKFN